MVTANRWHLHVGDRALAAGFVLAAAVEAVARFRTDPAQLTIALLGSVTWAALIWRRSRPLLTIFILASLSIIGSLLQRWLTPDAAADSAVAVVALLVASYSLGAHGSRRAVLVGAPVPAVLIVVVDLLQPSDESLARAVPFAVAFVVVAPVLGGRIVRARSGLVERLRAQAAELRAHQVVQAAADLAQERLRLTGAFHTRLLTGMQELADLIDHADREDGEAALRQIEQAARGLLTQTRHAVVTLADAKEGAPEPVADRPSRVPPGWDARPWTALAAAAQGAGLLIELHALGPRIPMPLAVFACVGLVLPLALLWAAPLPLTALQWLLAAGFGAVIAPLHASTAAIGLLFAVPFAVAALVSLRGSVLGLVLCCLGGAVTFGGQIGGALIICTASWLAGRALRDRAQMVEQLRRNAALLTAQRDAIARQGIVAERARLARDLHDAIGHSLTVVALQAGAARRLWSTDPGRAAEVLGTVAGVARDGLRELAGSLDVADVTASAPGMDSLDALLAGARLAGLPVQADLDDISERADPDTCAVLYRVLQESLTNVLTHAPEATVRVALHWAGDHVDLTVTNSAGRAPGRGGGTGHGLTGMRDRVAARGGRLDWSSQPDGGFRVHAQLPLAMAPA